MLFLRQALCIAPLIGAFLITRSVPAMAAETITYTYDAQGRLLGVSSPSNMTTYTYDLADNRTQMVSTAVGVPPSVTVNSNISCRRTDWGLLNCRNPVTATVSGGAAPYTYEWSLVNDPVGVSPTIYGSDAQAWVGATNSTYNNDIVEVTFGLKVIDSTGAFVTTNFIVSFTWDY